MASEKYEYVAISGEGPTPSLEIERANLSLTSMSKLGWEPISIGGDCSSTQDTPAKSKHVVYILLRKKFFKR
jgi:hypothetical protein